MEVFTDDIKDFFRKEEHQEFIARILRNTMRYVKLFSDAADEIELFRTKAISEQEEMLEAVNKIRVEAFQKKEACASSKEMLNLLKRKL